jgi:hypothetical protein
VRFAIFFLVLASGPGVLLGQSSQFGVRGLGFPSRELAPRAAASGGAFGLFDPESSQNPAALSASTTVTSVFTISQGFRHQENPAGTASIRDTRFPQFMIAGPIRQSGSALGFSYSNYTDRDFTIASSHVVDLRGVPVAVTDSFSSRGGLSDLRLAGAYQVRNRWTFGLSFHVITGTNRLTSQRFFNDSSYLASRQTSEISYAGIGLSAGIVYRLSGQFAIAALARSDGHLNVDRDSVRVSTIDLPYTFGLGFRLQPSAKLDLAAQGMMRTWSGANSDLLQQGGTGAENTFEVAAGAEFIPDEKRPFRRPLRFGAHYAQLPFPLVAGEQGHEIGVSAGSGIRFAQQRGGIDLTLEHLWRSEGVYSERGFVLSLGVSVRP